MLRPAAGYVMDTQNLDGILTYAVCHDGDKVRQAVFVHAIFRTLSAILCEKRIDLAIGGKLPPIRFQGS